MLEIRFHGRGGQGAVTTAELLALSAISEGKFAQAFPSFGPERRGAPVMAFCRVDDKPIRLRAQITEPDVALVLDPGLLDILDPSKGLKKNGVVVLNTRDSAEHVKSTYKMSGRLALVDALTIAIEELGRPITNTAMLGVLIKATGVVNLESLEKQIDIRFGRIAAKNIKAYRRAYNETKIEE